MESPFKNTLEHLKNEPQERVAKAMRRAYMIANNVSEYVVPHDFWTAEEHTPEWLRDDFRTMARAAMTEMREMGCWPSVDGQ